MSRGFQWVVGASAVVIALAALLVILAVFAGMAGVGMTMAPALWAGVGGLFGGAPTGMMSWANRGPGSFGGLGGMMGGMMGGYGMAQDPWAAAPIGTARLSLDQARAAAEEVVGPVASDLVVTEVMEFENNFYALVTEADTGRGAFELLITPYTGAVGAEPGPNMMWNDRYGHMRFGGGGENRLSMEEARAIAQRALDAQFPGSRVHEDGASFYGYYTFDFDAPDGSVAGMLSVEGTNGALWMHTWHGPFVGEWEAQEASS